VSWYRKAAEQGFAVAQGDLGTMYARGDGVQRDYVLAYMWFNLAAERGFKPAIRLREAAEAFLTPSQIEEAKRLAKEWKPQKSR
jgi:TPR repeat protein